jgi:hypothetical protein
MNGLEETSQPQQRGGACAQQPHFVGGHEDMTLDELCQLCEKRNEVFHILLSNRFERQQFSS